MALNPVERRLLYLCDHWARFVDDRSKRLLIWQVPGSAVRMIQCFFEAQKHETPYTTGDLFISFDVPFENSVQYSRALKEALAGQYEASREDLKQQGIASDWDFTPQTYPDSPSGFVQSLRFFGSKHHKQIGYLVPVFMPQHVIDDDAFFSWLTRVLGARIPERLRFAVIDSMEAPRLTSLVGSGHKLVFVDSPKINTLATAQETFAQEGAVGPAAVFRNFLMGVVTLIEKGTADQVKAKARDALAFARKEKWADQEVVLRILVAGSLLKGKRFDEAVKMYLSARQSASQAASAGHPAGAQLVLQTWFGEAGTHFAAGDVKKAGECYDKAAVVARKIPNAILSIEALRMAAFCYSRANLREEAVLRGTDAFRIGEALKPEARAMTTLPIAAVDLLRIVEPARVTQMEEVKHRLDARIDASRRTLEQQAQSLGETATQQQFQALEDDLSVAIAAADLDADRALESITSAGNQQFRRIFVKAREMLGKEWPLFSPAAMPRTPQLAAATGAQQADISGRTVTA
ncbi:MAG: hypothetical protein ACREVK_01270 [Gammaproteobacteria bacterium]